MSSGNHPALGGLFVISFYAAFHLMPNQVLPPVSWALISVCIWLAYGILRPDHDRRCIVWGIGSGFALLSFLAHDPDFNSWGDVYFFCGSRMQYCTCNFRWNLAGWYKAVLLWNFVLSSAIGIQRLVIQLGLKGLLPGEEVVTRESFISICWRLIPYWLNNWEQQWGAECSSMMFELPHFAVELLIILPCVQILCSRMKVLAMPSVNAALPPGRDGRPEVVREEYVPNVLCGCWERQPLQKHIWQRIRANKRIIGFTCLLCLLAGFNALVIPLHLEKLIVQHPDAALMQLAGRLPDWHDGKGLERIHAGLQQGSVELKQSTVVEQAATMAAAAAVAKQQQAPSSHGYGPLGGSSNSSSELSAAASAAAAVAALSVADAGPWQHNSSWAISSVQLLLGRIAVYQAEPRQCTDLDRLQRNLLKHHEEIFRMQDPQHQATIPLVEAALALMRLSTEKFFVLLSLYVAFLVFRVPPCWAATLISLNARISAAFARLILYSFPAVCWVYGAGFIFSTFVSVVFWGGPIMQLYEWLRSSICSVSIKALKPATAAEVEHMHGDCAICWCEMTVASASSGSNSSSTLGSSEQQQHADTAVHVERITAASSSNQVQSAAEQQQLNNRFAATTAATAGSAPAGSLTPSPAAGAAKGVAVGLAAELEHAGPASATAAVAAGGVIDVLELVGTSTPPVISSHGCTLPCGHCYHHQCLTQWLQQCRSQGGTPTCPMCQARLQLHIHWHLFGPKGARNRPHGLHAAGLAAAGGDGGDGDVGDGDVGDMATNNYLLAHQPRLAELLADMPQILAQENVQLLAEVQDLRQQRQQLVGELHLRQQQLQELAGRRQQLELEGMEMEQQRRQLLQELQLLRRARKRQQQLQQHIQQQQNQLGVGATGAFDGSARDLSTLSARQEAAGAVLPANPVACGADVSGLPVLVGWRQQHQPQQAVAEVNVLAGDLLEGMNSERYRQLEMLLDTCIREQEQAASGSAASAAAAAVFGSRQPIPATMQSQHAKAVSATSLQQQLFKQRPNWGARSPSVPAVAAEDSVHGGVKDMASRVTQLAGSVTGSSAPSRLVRSVQLGQSGHIGTIQPCGGDAASADVLTAKCADSTGPLVQQQQQHHRVQVPPLDMAASAAVHRQQNGPGGLRLRWGRRRAQQ